MMTYGEYIYVSRNKLGYVQDGLFVFPKIEHLRKMDKQKAIKYYTKKFKKVW